MLEAIEEDTWGFLTDFGRRPGGEVGEDAGARWFRSGVPFVNYNGVAGVSGDVEGMVARVRSWGVPARWVLSSVSTPAGFDESLVARGVTLYEDAPGMAVDIDNLPEPQLAGATVEVVAGETQSDEWAAILADAFKLPPQSAAQVRSAHGWPHMHQAGLLYLLIRLDGRAVATGLLRSASGVAGVYGIGVRRDYQRRGLGRLATLLTAHEGARRGARVAVLSATADGLIVYEKLGFKTLTRIRSWRIA